VLRDIYCIPADETRYDSGRLEVFSEIEEIIQQIDLIFFTRPGEVLNMPKFGIDLEKYLFSTTFNEAVIENEIRTQIDNFIYAPNHTISTSVSFHTWEYNIAMVVEIVIKDHMGNSETVKYIV